MEESTISNRLEPKLYLTLKILSMVMQLSMEALSIVTPVLGP